MLYWVDNPYRTCSLHWLYAYAVFDGKVLYMCRHVSDPWDKPQCPTLQSQPSHKLAPGTKGRMQQWKECALPAELNGQPIYVWFASLKELFCLHRLMPNISHMSHDTFNIRCISFLHSSATVFQPFERPKQLCCFFFVSLGSSLKKNPQFFKALKICWEHLHLMLVNNTKLNHKFSQTVQHV